MASTSVALLLCAVLAIANGSLLAPRDLVDEIGVQLDQLETLVKGEILAAHDKIDNTKTDFDTESTNRIQSGLVSLEEQQRGAQASLNSIKELGNSRNTDISECTDGPEDALNKMPEQFAQRLSSCIGDVNVQADKVADDAKYTVDVIINRVNQLEFHFNQCSGDLLCLSPLVTEIELEKVRSPQNIGTEVQVFEGFLSTLEISLENCDNNAQQQYGAQTSSLFRGIMVCVNRIIT